MIKLMPTEDVARAMNKNYVYGLGGLAKLLGCSKPTAWKIKNSGAIPYGRIGKKFIFDADRVMEALEHENE